MTDSRPVSAEDSGQDQAAPAASRPDGPVGQDQTSRSQAGPAASFAGPAPESFPVSLTQDLRRRRAVFSAAYAGLGNVHVISVPEALSMVRRRSRRPAVINGSLQLLDDLTNRPVDPLFEDARLVKRRPPKPVLTLATRLVTFILCAIVGLGTLMAIQELHKDSRQKVRTALAGQLTQAQASTQRLDAQVRDLQVKVGQLSERLDTKRGQSPTTQRDDLTNATTRVEGPGLQVILDNPDKVPSRVINPYVGDADLRAVVNLLWAGGAEAISVNNIRLGPQTSIRVAGSTILIGVTGISPPYIVSAIGSQKNLENAVQSPTAKGFFDMLEQRGIQPAVSEQSDLQLTAVELPTLAYAGRSE